MIVVDASVGLEVLLRTPRGRKIEPRLLAESQLLCAPHLLDVEVAQVLRRYALAGELDAQRGAEALQDLADLPIERYPHDVLLPRVWELRDNLTAYDAVYIALAEILGAALMTADRRLADSPGHSATVRLV
jgi:predicted nucleic acid-binding protein